MSITDLGVTFKRSSNDLVRVADKTQLGSGQYHVDEATGVYSFSHRDSRRAIFIEYSKPGEWCGFAARIPGDGTKLPRRVVIPDYC